MNNNYVKTVNSTLFTVNYGDYDICDVYVIPTISNRLSNAVTIISTRDYIFVSKHLGNDNNNGLSRNTPVNTIKKAKKEEGGRHTPFSKGYKPQFYFRTTDVTGEVELPADKEMVQ